MRIQLNLILDADDSIELEKLKSAVSNTLNKSPKLEVVSLAARMIAAPGRPAVVAKEIEGYLSGLIGKKKFRSARMIAKAIHRGDRSVYKPLREMTEAGLLIQGKHPNYPSVKTWAWNEVPEADRDQD